MPHTGNIKPLVTIPNTKLLFPKEIFPAALASSIKLNIECVLFVEDIIQSYNGVFLNFSLESAD